VVKTAEGVDRATKSIVSASDAVSRISSEQLESVRQVHDSLDGVNQKATDIAGSAASVSASMEESSSSALELSTAGLQLRESANLLFTNVEEISTSIEQMARSMESLHGNADSLSTAWEEKSTQMEEMVASFRQVETNAGDAQEMSRKVIERAASGRDKTTAAMEKMETIAQETEELRSAIHDLGEQTSGITGIVDVIDSVADETKLLALNAAIIAAQAGSQGGAFAVVAEHVKELAARVLDNTKEITDVVSGVRGRMESALDAIGRVTPRVSEGVETAAEARTSLEEITQTAQESGQLVAQIVSAAREQDRAAAHALKLIEGVRSEVNNIRTAISEQKAANQAMLRSSESLREVGQQVRGTAAEHATNVGQIRDGVEGASEASRSINEALEKQSASSQEILALMHRLLEGTRGSETVVQEMKSEMLELETETQALRESVKRFQV
jgi:methyl-accepting chemotaxis protein